MLSKHNDACYVCGWIARCSWGNMEFSPLLLTHLGNHMNAIVKLSDSDGFAMINVKYKYDPEDYPTEFACAADRFPQLSLIRALNEEEFNYKISDIFQKCYEVGMGINDLFDHVNNAPRESIYDDFVELVTKTEYICGLCEMNYESGLPSIEVASKHAGVCCKAI